MVTREQQTALHIRQHSAEETTEEGCVAGTPSLHHTVATARSPRRAASWRSWYCERSTGVIPAPRRLRAPSSTGGGRGEGVWHAFVLGLNFRSLGLESTFRSFLWQELLGYFCRFPQAAQSAPADWGTKCKRGCLKDHLLPHPVSWSLSHLLSLLSGRWWSAT